MKLPSFIQAKLIDKLIIFNEFFLYCKERKTWWLVPIILLLLLMGSLLVLTEGSVVSPFIYAMF